MIRYLVLAQVPSKYGPFADIVPISVAIMAAALAIGLAWKGRFSFEPSEEDIPTAPQKVGGLISGVLIALLWATATPANDGFLIKLALYLTGGTLIFLLLYGYLIGALTYTKVIAVSPKKTQERKIIGGFSLTENARKALRAGKVATVQDLLNGSQNKEDAVWTKSSRAFAKQCFVLAYIGFVACGTIALAVAAIIVNFRVQ